jgi:hypothetical protein
LRKCHWLGFLYFHLGRLRSSLWTNGFSCDLCFEVRGIELIEEGLIFHQLNLEILVSFIMICYEVVDCLKERSEGFAVIFLFKKKLFLGEYLD